MKQKKEKKLIRGKHGSALLLTTILLFVVLSIVISLTYVTVMEQKMSSKTKSSVGAFFNADSGVEWALNKIANEDGSKTINTAFATSGFDGNAAKCPFGADTCKVYFLDQDGKVLTIAATLDQVKAVRAVGTQGGETQRAIEAAVAAGGSGTYIVWGDSSCVGGDDLIYSGNAVFPVDVDGGGQISGAGGIFCLKGGSPASWANSNYYYWADGKHQSPPGSMVIQCAVCAR